MRSAPHRERVCSERGSMSIFLALLIVAFVGMSLVLADGARRLGNISRAEDLASEVARAAAATLEVSSLATGSAELANQDDLEAQAEVVLGAVSNARLVSLDVGDSGRFVDVVVEVSGTSIIPGFDVTAQGRHSAQVVDPFDSFAVADTTGLADLSANS